MQKSSISYDSCDNIYLNLTLYNDTEAPILATYYDQRSSYYIEDPSRYYLAVTRFNIPTTLIPIFIYVPNSYYVTLSYNGFSVSEVVPFIPLNSQTLPGQMNQIVNVNQFLDAVNQALASAFTALGLLTLYPAGVTRAPYLIWDPTSEEFSLIAEYAYYNVNPVNTIEIFFNSDLYHFFQGLEAYNNGFNLANHQDYRLIVANRGNNLYTYNQQTPLAPTDSYQMLQQATSIFNWFDINSYVFTTDLPINREQIATRNNPALVGSQNSPSQNTTRNILTDYEVVFQTAAEYFSAATFNQVGPYRFIDILSNTPLRIMSLTLQYQTHNRELRPVYIAPRDALTIKLLFYKKQNARDLAANKLM